MTDRDVLWITLESVRYDHTSLGGYERRTTPNLERLSADGVSFDRCYSHDVWTRSSSASMLTGQAPSAHRTWSNGAKLPDAIRTIPEAFRDAGYRTACLSPNGNLSPDTGLDRGFEHFHQFTGLSLPLLVEKAGVLPVAKWLARFRRHTGGPTRNGSEHCFGYLQNEVAKRHVDAVADREGSLFLYLHHGDTHHAYVPPLSYREQFLDGSPMGRDEAVALALEMAAELHRYIAREPSFTDAEWEVLEAMYDACLAYVDSLVGDLVNYARDRLENPLVVVTADHGELFGEKGLLAHMLCTDRAVSHVPMVVLGLDDLPDGGLVQPVDVMEMLCAETGVDHQVPIGRDVRDHPREFAVTQRGGERARTKLEKITAHNGRFPTERFHREDLTTLRTDDWCYHSSEGRSELVEHSDETSDVSDSNPGVCERLASRCESWLETYGQPVGETGTAEFDGRVETQLRELGYL